MIEGIDVRAAFAYERVAPGEELPNLAGAPVVAVDVETKPVGAGGSGLDPWRGELLGFSVAVPGRAWYLPLRHRAPGSEQFNLDPDGALAWLRDVVAGARVLVNHNLKFDLKFLARAGVVAPDRVELWCTLVAAQLLDEREPTHALKPLAAKLLGMPAVEEAIVRRYLAEAGQGRKDQDWSVLPADLLAPYACGDVERALKLAAYQAPRLAAEGLEPVHALERRVTRALVDGELRGVDVDVEALNADSKRLLGDAIQLEERIEKQLGVSVNPNSVAELADVVATRLGLPILHRTAPTERYEYGQPKFDDSTLLEYARLYPQHAEAFWAVRQVRRLHHVRGSFLESYRARHVGGTVHGNFNQSGTRTGRMSSSDPNLQQVPPDETWDAPDGTEWRAPGARKYFVPRAGHVFLLFDYSQIEYRFFAHFTNSPRLVDAYRDDPTLDMHRWAAEGPLGGRVPRDVAKNINFGIIYGMGERKLIASMNRVDAPITEQQGREILQTYYANVPELRPLQLAVARALKGRGYVKTVLGRRRRASAHLQATRDDEERDRGLLPYQALNAICQGGAGDVLKDRLAEVWERRAELGATPLVTIHDELIFEAPAETALESAAKIRDVLQRFDDADGPYLKVPLYVSTKVARTRWSEAEKVKL